jgi:calcium permeable stress-gated cation channel
MPLTLTEILTVISVVGLYIEHICLAALFFLRATDEGAAAVVKAVMMLVLAGFTVVAQLFIKHSFDRMS